MRRTMPSYSIALKSEIYSWRSFRKRLLRSERKEFDRMTEYSILHAPEASMAVRASVFEGMAMSIVFHHYLQLRTL